MATKGQEEVVSDPEAYGQFAAGAGEDKLQQKLESAREAVQKDPSDKNNKAYRDASQKVAEARSAWRADEEAADRRPGPGNPAGSAFQSNGNAVAAPDTVEASSEVE